MYVLSGGSQGGLCLLLKVSNTGKRGNDRSGYAMRVLTITAWCYSYGMPEVT